MKISQDDDVAFRVWGCRGSVPAPGAETVRYGGDTTCFEIVAGGANRLIVDCGSGMRRLGHEIIKAGEQRRINVLLTHFHADHLIGLGLFAPLIAETADVSLWNDRGVEELRTGVERLYAPPTWPISLTQEKPLFLGRLPSETSLVGDFMVRPFRLSHPGGATGYEIAVKGRRIVIVTDHETGDAFVDANVTAIARDADLLVFDAPYSAEEYNVRRGWGHSPREDALRIAREAEVRQLLLTHHEASATDASLDSIACELTTKAPIAALAYDGMTLPL